jgi:hypothetical protein
MRVEQALGDVSLTVSSGHLKARDRAMYQQLGLSSDRILRGPKKTGAISESASWLTDYNRPDPKTGMVWIPFVSVRTSAVGPRPKMFILTSLISCFLILLLCFTPTQAAPRNSLTDKIQTRTTLATLFEVRPISLVLIETKLVDGNALKHALTSEQISETARNMLIRQCGQRKGVEIVAAYPGDDRQTLSTTLTVQLSVAVKQIRRSTAKDSSAQIAIAMNLYRPDLGNPFFLSPPDVLFVRSDDPSLEKKITAVLEHRLQVDVTDKLTRRP